MNAAAPNPRDLHRPVMLSQRERRRLDGIAGGLERRNYKQDAALVRELAARWDGAEGFVVVHEAAVAVRPEGEPA